MKVLHFSPDLTSVAVKTNLAKKNASTISYHLSEFTLLNLFSCCQIKDPSQTFVQAKLANLNRKVLE